MRIAILAMYTPRMIMEMLVFVPVLLLILFGITSVGIGGFYFIRIVAAHLRGEPIRASRERAISAGQASDLARLALACGPLLSFALSLIPCLLMFVFDKESGRIMSLGWLLLMTGIGAVAGLIAAGAFWVSSGLLGRFRKAVKRLKGGGVWDAEIDGLP